MFLPLGLSSMSLSLLVVLVAQFLTSYVLLGIDEIGVELEQPFALLPLNSLCEAIMNDVRGKGGRQTRDGRSKAKTVNYYSAIAKNALLVASLLAIPHCRRGITHFKIEP